MESGEHPDQARAQGFGAVAHMYDRARPTYPPALVARLLSDAPVVDVVDVGCGTGKAARLFIGGGRRVLGIEPDPRMAAVAAAHGIDVEVTEFESWDDRGRRFDLLISGQAWHWVDPVKGAEKAAKVLRPGGRFAAFWNKVHHTDQVRSILEEVYSRHAPEMLSSSVALGVVGGTVDPDRDPAAAALAGIPFGQLVGGERESFPWTLGYTPHQWVEHVATHSDHRLLDPLILEALLRDLESALQSLGPKFLVSFYTDLLSAERE